MKRKAAYEELHNLLHDSDTFAISGDVNWGWEEDHPQFLILVVRGTRKRFRLTLTEEK